MPKELPKAYEAKNYEDQIYHNWEESGCFRAEVGRGSNPYVISMPPPNATGTLHLGHAMMLAVEDTLIRFHRMLGEDALWVPGTDHASIATQNKVERIIAEEGTDRHQMGREKFLERVDEFVKGSQNTIRNQTRKMGSSCDWSRERYTLDEGLTHAVQTQFVKMYEDGLIYRGYRIVNWCPRCGSTLADDEVENVDTNAKFYYIKYGPFVVATSRPETKLADTAVAVNPNDERYKRYIGQEMDVDLAGHKIHIKVIADEEVDMELGTGALGVTPAHSMVDYEMAQKNNLEVIKLIDEEGKITEAGGRYAGMTVLKCREAFVKDLQEAGQMEKIEDYVQPLSVCYRCKSNVEPLPSEQWFIDVNKKIPASSEPIVDLGGEIEVAGKSLKELMLEVIQKKQIAIMPERFEKTYFHWIENLRDWCISRQIWFGHRIPVWYREEEIYVGTDVPEGDGWKQDEDTLDTWFSSGLWTFSTLGWPNKTEDLQYFHPTSCMETGYDILFFWVARMILMTTYATRQIPFKTVYLHGLVRTMDGKKMSKSHPETCIDPLEMIEKYGADAVRLSLIIGTSVGNDTKLNEEKIQSFRNFVNKIWNTARFALMNVENLQADQNLEIKNLADSWIMAKLQEVVRQVTDDLQEYRLSAAGEKVYDFLWHDFADWYLEMSKVEKNEGVILHVLKTALKLLHPFVPFVTEALWAELGEEKMILANWPEVQIDFEEKQAEEEFETLKNVIMTVRNLRAESNIPAGNQIKAVMHAQGAQSILQNNSEIMRKMCRIEELEIADSREKITGAVSAVSGSVTIYIPLAGAIDTEAEKARLEKEIANLQNYTRATEGKLSNDNFVKNAPEAVVNGERAKLAEAQEKLAKLQENLQNIA